MGMATDTVSVLFVCLGNICRSPLAEGIFLSLAESRGLGDRFHVDSAGTGSWHTGEPPDTRSISVAAAHGVRLVGVARQVTRRDFDDFDVIVAMDRSNRRSLERLRGYGARAGKADVVMMRAYEPRARDPDVPDPYYGGSHGFERVFRILERSCEGLLDDLSAGLRRDRPRP